MKVFISSLITGMDSLRAAAREAVLQLGHEPVMAEDFGARPHSPQVTCLSSVREAGLIILTHEEYREAKDRCPVLAFVEQGVTRDAGRAAFVREVQDWASRVYRNGSAAPAHHAEEREPVHLTPAVRPRPALRHQAGQFVEDLVTPLRREWRAR